ncbi:MAG TPA: carboxy terminal-processing peptidase [Flavipsychrobacter sp.]|nr:carboxy terminal-processing peptidase [Flavipsychrobacter sp.]
MKNKILIPVLIVGALAAFFSFRYAFAEGDQNKKTLTLETVMETIKRGHFDPRPVDDSFSVQVFKKTLNSFDYRKNFFTQKEIQALSKYQYQIDDQINSGSVEFFNELDKVFIARVNVAEGMYKEILKTPFSFTENDSVKLDGEGLEYAPDDAALKNRWEKYLKYQVLSKYVDLKKGQENNKDKDAKKKTDTELEADARQAVLKNQDLFFKRLRRLDETERFAIFMNGVTNAEDPHTDFLPPEDKARFDESMSGSFYGIGAQLQEDEGNIKVVMIIPGSPCWKQGELKVDDIIQKVAQDKAEPVDVQGYDLDDVVKMIRGNKGTTVRLTVKKVDGSVRIIPITRGEVLREETFAKSAIIEEKGSKTGYIYLPEFYADFNKINGRRCAEDVAIEVQKLKNAGVDGIILDLRNNGGGSLQDVVDMAGLFIDQGPVVQVKTNAGAPEKLYDRAGGTLYDGPLAVMINQGSASASEIMAAAMQDYKRAVIVGSTSFGKGTVQRLISLDEMAKYSSNGIGLASNADMVGDGIGSLKITVQKFYRINGGSTQLRGVTPDIMLPDPYQDIDMGERRDKAALKWDEIPAVKYQTVTHPVNVNQLSALSLARVNTNGTFKLIKENAKKLKDRENNRYYQLNEKAYRKELDEASAISKKMEELEKKAIPLTITNPKEDMAKINMDSSTVARNTDWLKNIKKDIYIAETVNVIHDMQKGSAKLEGTTGMK